jgi:hypothetical protein
MNLCALITGTNYEGSANRLRGCLNDVKNLSETLAKLPGTCQQALLAGEHFTKPLFLGLLKELYLGLPPGGMLFVSNSSHGTRIPVTSADRPEPDGYVEAIVMDDYDGTRDTLIIDDELYDIFALRSDVTAVCWSDSCFSGDLTRDAAAYNSRFVPYTGEPLCRGELKEQPQLPNVIGLSGCRSDQTSADAYIDGKYQGAFTYAGCKVLRESFRDGKFELSYLEFNERTVAWLKQHGYSQRPQLDCVPAMMKTPFLGGI